MNKLNISSKFYRLITILRSIKALYQLSPQQVNSFIKSYEIYDYDWIQGQAANDKNQVEYPHVKKQIINWYEVLNHLCAIGNLEKMYIPPAMDLSKDVVENQLLFEKMFCQWLGMKSGDKVLELGCGRGRVAAHLASITGAHITGINIDQSQIDNAVKFAKKQGLSHQCQFVNKDFNDLPFPFPDNYFDCIYEVQALSLSKNLNKLFCELHRILKPGGKLSLSEWVRLPNYNPQNSHHVDLLKRIKPLVGAIGTPSIEEYESALQNSGFNILISKNPNINNLQLPLIKKTSHYFSNVNRIINILVKLKIMPKHFIPLLDRLGADTDALCEADKLGLITMTYHFIAENG